MTDNQSIDLTRRRVLGGLGAIGVASAGAALGTSAYFSDEENFEGNTLTAGELDLFVHYEFDADQDGVEVDNLAEPASGTVQGDTDEFDGDEVSVGYGLEDVKPGDSGTLQFCFSLVDNPAHLWIDGEETANDENGYTEPEPETDGDGDINDPGDASGAGELAESIEMTIDTCGEGDSADLPIEGTFAEIQEELGEDGAYLGIFEGGETPDDPTDARCICCEWEIPTDVGNEIQTDSLEWDITFAAEQARHNDDPDSPFNASNAT